MISQQYQQNDPSLTSHYLGGIGDWLRYHAWYRPDTEALIYGGDRVTYADLDLQTAAGQKTLESRIDRASRKACGYTIQGRGNLSAEQAVRSCFDKAKARANRQFAARADAAAMGG